MEDVFSVAYQHTKEGQDLEYAYFGIFDGHGGKHAAIFAKEHLMDNIVSNPYFWSENDEDVLKAIKEGFLTTHQAMFKVLGRFFIVWNIFLQLYWTIFLFYRHLAQDHVGVTQHIWYNS